MHHHVSLPALLLRAEVENSTPSATPLPTPLPHVPLPRPSPTPLPHAICHTHLISFHQFHLLLPVFKPLLDVRA